MGGVKIVERLQHLDDAFGRRADRMFGRRAHAVADSLVAGSVVTGADTTGTSGFVVFLTAIAAAFRHPKRRARNDNDGAD